MSTRWDTAKATKHLTDLAIKHKIIIIWTDKPECAHSQHRTVYIHRPRNALEYMGALHEFGHILSPRARNFQKRWDRGGTIYSTEYDDCLLMESAAWAWAARFCDEDLFELISQTTWKQIGTCIMTYLPSTRYIKVGPK